MSRQAPRCKKPLDSQVLHALLVSTEKDCRTQIADVFNDLSDHDRRDHSISRVGDLENWLIKRPQLFNVSTDIVTNRRTVSPTTTLTCCATHSACAGSCPKGACAELHICRYFLLSEKCPFEEGCHFGHRLGTRHNRRLLKRHRLIDLSTDDLRKLFCLARVRGGTMCPPVCRFYNMATKCEKGRDCHFIHLCKYFVTGKCKFKSGCKRSHNIYDNQVLNVLELYGIETEGRRDADILQQIRVSDSTADHKKDGSGMDITQRSDDFPPEIYGRDLSSESDSLEEGEISEDCTLSIPLDDVGNSERQQISGMLKSIRQGQERPETSRWGNESLQISRYTEPRSGKNETPVMSRLMQENMTIRYDPPRTPEDGERRRDSPESLSPGSSTSVWESISNNNRGYNSLQMSAREKDSLTISVRKRDWQQEWDHTRPDAPRASEHRVRSSSPNLADNWKRSSSRNLADRSWERYESPDTAYGRRYPETSPVLEYKRRKNDSQQLAEDTWNLNLPQSENDRGKHGKKRRHSPQVPRLLGDQNSEWPRTRSETHQRGHGLPKYSRKQRTARSSRRVTLLEDDTREDAPQTSRCSPENEARRRLSILDVGFQEDHGNDEMQEIPTRRRPHTSPSLGQRHGHLSTRSRQLSHKKSSTHHKGESSSSLQKNLNKVDWLSDY